MANDRRHTAAVSRNITRAARKLALDIEGDFTVQQLSMIKFSAWDAVALLHRLADELEAGTEGEGASD